MQKIYALIVLIGFLLSKFVYAGAADCKSQNTNSSCILVNEVLDDSTSAQLPIYFHWLNPPSQEKRTFIFLNGGPGSSFDAYTSAKEFWSKSNLAKDYNVLLFDPRGVGRSSPLTSENIKDHDLNNYQIKNLVEDIESLRKALVPNQKIGIIGHSFGGHLVFAYALKYPESTFSLISLHGAGSAIGFVTQPYFQNKEWEKMIKNVDPEKLEKLKAKMQRGEACSVPDEKPLPPGIWTQLQTLVYVGTYAQRQTVPGLIQQSIELNIDKNKVCPFPVAEKPAGAPASSMATLGMNVYANKAIVCRSFLTKTQLGHYSSEFQNETARRVDRQCGGDPSLDNVPVNDFHVLSEIKNLKIPMLIIGGANDQIVSTIAQQEIWDNLSAQQKLNSSISILPECGHDPMSENPTALNTAINGFLEKIK